MIACTRQGFRWWGSGWTTSRPRSSSGSLDGTFTALLSRDGLIIDGRHVRRFHGRWIRDRGILLTAVVLGST